MKYIATIMGQKTNTIKINGQPYDTSTGEAVTVSVKTGQKSAAKTAVKTPVSHGKKVMDVKRAGPQHAKPHQPEAGKTLMRQAVKKPAVKSKVTSKSKPAHAIPVVIADTKRVANPAKVKQAQAVPQSQLITHFSSTTVKPVANHPHAVKPMHAPKPAAVIDIKPRPVVLPETKAYIPSADIFQNALERASSHEQPAIKKSRKKASRSVRGLKIASSALAVVLLAGFIAYQNIAQINIRVAAKKAGFAAALPSYQPSGFSVGAFHYSPGTVTVNFHSNIDQRSYALTEKSTQWDTQTLRERYVADNAGASYEVVEANGQTIFVYGQKNATWVKDNVWYTVQANGSLSNHQLIELAASI